MIEISFTGMFSVVFMSIIIGMLIGSLLYFLGTSEAIEKIDKQLDKDMNDQKAGKQ